MTRRKRLPALNKASYPKQVSVLVDQDYEDSLDEGARQWLADFNNGYYGHKFKNSSGIEWTEEMRRDAYRIDNNVRVDVLHRESTQSLDAMRPRVRALAQNQIERRHRENADPDALMDFGTFDSLEHTQKRERVRAAIPVPTRRKAVRKKK